MNSFKMALLLAAASTMITACGKKATEDSSDSIDATASVVESGMSVVSGLADDQAGSSFAMMSMPQKPTIWELVIGSSAYATSCTRAVNATCNNGVRSATFDACSLGSSLLTLSGSVTLTYSNNSCALSSTNDSVTRTYDIEIDGPRGGKVTHSSLTNSDYRGTSYGGGGRLVKTASGWEIDILGRHSSHTGRRGRELSNVSVRTLQPLSITGSLSRSGRTVASGQLEVNHNLAGFTAVFTPSNIQWSTTCCHPISGTLNVVYTGSKTGTATVTFNGCGQAQVDENGQTQSVEMSYCE